MMYRAVALRVINQPHCGIPVLSYFNILHSGGKAHPPAIFFASHDFDNQFFLPPQEAVGSLEATLTNLSRAIAATAAENQLLQRGWIRAQPAAPSQQPPLDIFPHWWWCIFISIFLMSNF